MKMPNDVLAKLDLQAEWYHRLKVDALRAEGERLRHELRRHGLDPAHVLMQAQQDATPPDHGLATQA